MRIGIDVDGVVLDFERRWAEAYYDWFGEKLPVKKRSLERAQMDQAILDWFDRADVWTGMPFVPGAKAGLDTLSERHTLAFLTSRPTAGERVLQADPWFRDNLYHVGWRDRNQIRCSLYVEDHWQSVERLRGFKLPVIRFGTEPFTTWRAVVAEIELITETGNSSTDLVLVEDTKAIRAREREVAAWKNISRLAGQEYDESLIRGPT